MEDQERLWLVREVVRLLLKAIKMRKLYDPKHAYTTGAVGELEQSIRGYASRHAVLRLEITREALLWENQRVYEEPNREANISYQLYLAGARQLTIRSGVTGTEVEQLLSVLAARPEEDVASLLWECEFKNIEYVCLDELMEGWSAPEGLSAEAQNKVREMNAHADRLISALASRGPLLDGVEHEVSDTAEELEEADKLPKDAARGDDEDEETIQVPPEAVAELKDAFLDATPEKNVVALLEVVFDGLALDPEALGDMNGRWALEEIPLVALRRANLSLLARVLERYRRELGGLKESTSWVAGAIVRTFERMWSPDRVDELVALALGGHAIGGPAAFASVLVSMGKQGVTAAVGAYLKSPPPELKTALERYLTENAVRDTDAMRRLVEPDVAPDLAKSALFIASKSVRGTPAEALYDVARAHPAKLVSDYATFLWRTSTPRGRLKAFQDALEASDPAERVRAADTLAKARDTQALEPLIRLVDEAGFASRTPEERRAFLGALVAIGGREAAGCLTRQTQRKASLFNRGATEQLRVEASRALEELRKKPSNPTPRLPGGPG